MRPTLLLIPLFGAICSSCSDTSTQATVAAKNSQPSGFVSLRQYSVPALEGWKKSVFSRGGSYISSVDYQNSVNNTLIKTSFNLYFTSQEGRRDALPDLKRSLDTQVKSAQADNPSYQVTELSETPYKGMPGMLLRAQGTRKSGGESQVKLWRIADGKNTFVFSQKIVGSPVSTEAQKEADAAWQTITQDLKIPK